MSEKQDRDIRSKKAGGNYDTNPRGTNRKAAALASSAEARLKQAARAAFGLLGGED